MSHTTWVVLTDGRYIRILFNQGEGKSLLTLKADDSKALADLSFEVVRQVKVGASNGKASKQKTDMQLLADFLSSQLADEQYQKLILVAPQMAIDELQGELNDEVKQTISSTLAEDLLATSVDDIEIKLADSLPG